MSKVSAMNRPASPRRHGLRAYHSDISLAPGGPSAASLSRRESTATAASSLSLRKSFSLLDDTDTTKQHSYAELIVAAETLENIVNESVFVGAAPLRKSKSGGLDVAGKSTMGDTVLKLVYGTMKYLTYIDIILVKTQFLVYHTEFLNDLGLVKVMLYDLMKYHFNYHRYPSISYRLPPNHTPADKMAVEKVKSLDECLRNFEVKLGAAYARIRVERRASGQTAQEQMANVLPENVREKEFIAVEMPKCLRVNTKKTTRAQIMNDLSRYADERGQTDIIVDPDFDDLLVVSPTRFSDIKASRFIVDGKLIFEDKTNFWGPQHIRTLLPALSSQFGEIHILDARAGCGIKALHLASVIDGMGKLIACESRPGRLDSFRMHCQAQGCENIEILEQDFVDVNPQDPRFAKVSVVVVEPPNSGSAVLDKLGYLLQEEEFPNDQYSQKDLWSLKTQQLGMLRHALSFPNVQMVLYITRSIHPEENEQVVMEALSSTPTPWELAYVLPEVPVERHDDFELEECLKIPPSEQTGNGIFIAAIQPTPSLPPTPAEPTELADGSNDVTATEVKQKLRRKRGGRRKVGSEMSHIRLSKSIIESVNRLSIPRGKSMSDVQSKTQPEQTQIKSRTSPHLSTEDSLAQVEHRNDTEVESIPAQQLSAQLQAAAPPKIAVFGTSLSNFYGPRDAAVRLMGPDIIPDNRWAYPVPNPTPWR
ncbi:S-adenosyl-L-methionine-dependent methyltransferase [Phlyctochytrium arcticum]|nr:S-adenosyl-L-methionine-dependent methyltransferase [Phlyctochytrium arcticum]